MKTLLLIMSSFFPVEINYVEVYGSDIRLQANVNIIGAEVMLISSVDEVCVQAWFPNGKNSWYIREWRYISGIGCESNTFIAVGDST